jgi:hypothetical protein
MNGTIPSKLGTIILEIKMDNLGQVSVVGPGVPPETVCKALLGIVIELIFTSFEKRRILKSDGT